MAYYYGWSKTEILTQVYPDEVQYYIDMIGKEQLKELKNMALASANAQTKKPKDLLNKIDKILNKEKIKGTVDDIERLLKRKGKL